MNIALEKITLEGMNELDRDFQRDPATFAGLTAVTARVIEKNTRSRRVLEKVGFAFVRQENGFLHYRCEKISR